MDLWIKTMGAVERIESGRGVDRTGESNEGEMGQL